MASTYEVEHRPHVSRRIALVELLLSPGPAALFKIMLTVCAAWAALIGWGAVSLIRLVAG